MGNSGSSECSESSVYKAAASSVYASALFSNSSNLSQLENRANRQNLSSDSHLVLTSRYQCAYMHVCTEKGALNGLLDWEQALYAWTGDEYYRQLNRALRENNAIALRPLRYLVMSIRRAIKQMASCQTLTLYRGTNITRDIAENVYEVGRSFLWPEFTASSLSKSVARRFAEVKGHGYVVVIKAPGIGTNYYTEIPTHWSQYPDEKEVLIYPYTGVVVTKVDHKNKEIYVTLKDTLIVEAEAGVSLGSCGPIPSSEWPSGKPGDF